MSGFGVQRGQSYLLFLLGWLKLNLILLLDKLILAQRDERW